MIGFRETTPDELAIDNTIEVNNFTGTASLSVPIRTSPGRESFGPDLALSYGSGERNSIFGVGWFLAGVPSIGIDTSQNLPTYQNGTERYVYGGGQELVPYCRKQGSQWLPVDEQRGGFRVQRYRGKIERSFMRFEKWTNQATGLAHWLVYARNGTISVFGKATDNSTRIADPADPSRRTFQWLLEAQYNPKGNAILYQYKPEDGAGVDATLSFESRRMRAGGGFAQRYIKRILYDNSKPLSPIHPTDPNNQWLLEVIFDYGEHSVATIPTPSDSPPASTWIFRKDPFSTYRPGFELRTYRLCRRILMFHRFPELGTEPCLVGATEFAHREDPSGSVLEAIQFRGYRKDPATGAMTERAVPPLKLTYSTAQTASSFDSSEPAENVPSGLDGTFFQWIDLRNEGLPGILHRQKESWHFKENFGDGRFGPLETVDEVPAAISASFHLQDFDNDGNLNLVGFEGREAGYYERDRDKGHWEGFQALQTLPRVDIANARVQWVDLNGDGHADLIIDHLDRLVWYPSEGADGFSPPVELAKPDAGAGGAPTLTQDRRLHTFFADMTGDGLLDMVRVDSGRVEYWPHLGQGRFGPGVVVEDAPDIEGFGEMDAARLRFADLDGSGAASLIYIGRGEVRYWINQSGNRFGPMKRLRNLPYIDSLSFAQVFDFLGDGSSCLVWSTPLPEHENRAIQYLRLTGDTPPRMLMSVSNGVGRETRLTYRSSASEYLRDKRSDRPWRILLPRHSMVVNRLEGIDHVSGSRMVTRYEYRDGYFDNQKRRFIGFGLIDTYDTDLTRATGTAAPEEVTPPSLTRSWYHVGSDNSFSRRAIDFYRADPLAVRLPDPSIEDIVELTTEEQLDAYRILAGAQWRQELYIIRTDGTREIHPLHTTEFSYRIQRRQPTYAEHDAAFSFVLSELLNHEYEQDPSDPRISHDILIENDPYGNVAQRVSLAYPRRSVGTSVRPEQQVLNAELGLMRCTNIDAANRFEVGIEIEERRYSLTGLAAGANGVFSRDALLSQAARALGNALAFHEIPDGTTQQARLIGMQRNRYWNDSRTAVLPVDQVGTVVLLHHTERAVLPEAAVNAAYGGRVTAPLLSGDGHYRSSDGYWWADDTTYGYRGASAFYRVEEETNPGGGRETYTFDAHFMLATAVEDIFGNRVESMPDYQALASSRIKDANNNVSETLYDPLGVAMVTGMRGQQLGYDGNAHPVGAEDLTTYIQRVGYTATDVLADPARFLQNASRFLFYDLEAFERGDGPPRGIHLERERHVHDGEGTAPSPSRIRVTVSYIDGFGRPIQTKVRADAGPAIQRDPTGAIVVGRDGKPVLADSAERWLASGHDYYNNKGWLVRKYEPLFSTSPNFEPDDALRRYGVTTRTRYDPTGRVIRQDLPNGTFTTSAYTVWETRQSDANDNVIGSDYEAARHPLPASDPEKTALIKAQAHAHTPTIVETDVMGRPFRSRELGEGGIERITTTIYGAMGLPDRVTDPRNLTALTYRYDMLGRVLFEHGMDSGDRWILLDTHGRTIHAWDGRNVHTEHRHDQNGRLTETRVDGALGLNNVVKRIVYGDNPVVPQATLRNARSRIVELYDDAGVVLFDQYDMDGQAIDTRRCLRNAPDAHKTTVDWSNPSAVTLDSVQHRSRTQIDGLGRAVAQSLPDGTTREYDYTALGHVAEVRVTSADGQLNRKVIATGIETNARGQRTSLHFGNGAEMSYEYNVNTFQLERLYARRTAGASRDYLDVKYTYDPVGNITRWIDRVQDPGATTPLIQGLTVTSACEFTYDAFYQLKTATGRVHQALLEHDYHDGLPDSNAVKGSRYLSLNNGAAVERYTRLCDYDLAGNIQRMHHQGVTHNWTTEIWTSSTSNRSLQKKDLNGIDIINPESCFDENGNTINLPHLRSMDWNYSNRLRRAVIIDRSSTGGPDDAEYYLYGAEGRRIRRVTERLVSGQLEVTETIFFEGCEIRRISYGGNTRLLRQTSHITDGSMRLATLHQWSIDQMALESDDVGEKKLHYLVGNHLGSVSLELDEAGDVISYEEYFPFGGTSFIAGQNARDVKLKEYRYSGKLRDDTTGFYCYEYRYYAPFIGNWLSPDPSGPLDGLNLYRFVYNNPIRFVDADGLQTEGELTREDLEGVTFERRGFEDVPPQLKGTLSEQEFREQSPSGAAFWVIEPGTTGWRDMTEVEAVKIAKESGVPIYLYDPTMPEGGGEATESTPTAANEDTGEQVQEGEGEQEKEPDGSSDRDSGTGNIQQGQTEEAGTNSRPPGEQAPNVGKQEKTAGTDTQGAGAGAGVNAGAGTGTGSSSAESKRDGRGPGGGDPRGRPSGVGTGGSSSSRSSGEAANGGNDLPPVPPGIQTDPNGIPYSQDVVLPEVRPEAGTPSTDLSQVCFGTGGDARGEPSTEKGGYCRPSGMESGEPNRSRREKRVEEKENRLPEETNWQTFLRWMGYLNFVFDKPEEGGDPGGIPGGLGLLHLSGTAVQILYAVATIVSTIDLAVTAIKSIARGFLTRLWARLSSPLATLRFLGSSTLGFLRESKNAVVWLARWIYRRPWSQFFRPHGSWRGPGSVITQTFWELRKWASTQRWRDRASFWFKPRWFGVSTQLYNWEHFFPKKWWPGELLPAANSYLNTFIRLPAQWNQAMGARLLPRLQYFGEIANALGGSFYRGFNLGTSFERMTNGPVGADMPQKSAREAGREE